MRRARLALALLLELQALLHAEPMLLVDDHERESIERDALPGTARACRSRRPRRRRRSPRAHRSRARGLRAEQRRDARRRAGRASASKFATCCSASSSVGAITAVWLAGGRRDDAPRARRRRSCPSRRRPGSSRFIGASRPRSARISANALCCAGVSVNGSAARKRASSSRGSGNGHERSLRIASAEARSDKRCAISSSSAIRRCAGWWPVASSAVAASRGGRCK